MKQLLPLISLRTLEVDLFFKLIAISLLTFTSQILVQNTIRSEFKEKTLLCIAHRLRTIINYDRVLVMSDGEVAEFDTPLNLYRSGKIFRSMCDRSNLTEADILKTEF